MSADYCHAQLTSNDAARGRVTMRILQTNIGQIWLKIFPGKFDVQWLYEREATCENTKFMRVASHMKAFTCTGKLAADRFTSISVMSDDIDNMQATTAWWNPDGGKSVNTTCGEQSEDGP